MANLVKVYWKDGKTTNDVAAADLSYWKSQGWSDAAPTASPAPAPAPVSSSVTPPAPSVTPSTPSPGSSTPSSSPNAQQAPSLPSGFTAVTKMDQWGNPDTASLVSAVGPDGRPVYDVWQGEYYDGKRSQYVAGYKAIPKATLVNGAGNRVAVRTDNPLDPGQGKYIAGGSALPTAQSYFSQGYALEKAPGIPVGNTQVNTPSGTDLSQQKNATLRKVNPDGSVSRVVVVSGSPDAQKYFANGYSLETAAQAPDVAVTMKAPDGSTVAAKNKAEADALMAKGYAPVTVAPNTPVNTPASTYGITNPDDANAIINKAQDQFKANGDQSNEPPTRNNTSTTTPTTPGIDWSQFMSGTSGTSGSSLDKAMTDALAAITAAKAPTVPSLQTTYGDLKTKYGTTDLEASLNDLNTQQNAIIAQRAERIASEKGKPVDLSLAAGRISEVEQQENTRLAAIQSQIASVQGQLKTKMDTVDTLMKYAQLDYQNASDSYDKSFSQSLSAINLIRGISQDQKTDAEKAKDDARANLQIVYNTITSNGSDISKLSTADKLNITKLELQAGLPQGFYATLQSKNPKQNIIASTQSVENGRKFEVVLMSDDSGNITTKKFDIGQDTTTSKPFELSPSEITSIVDKYKDPQQAIDYMRSLYNSSNGIGASANGSTAAVVSALPSVAPQGSVWKRDGVAAPECGQFVNDVTGVGVGDSLASKKAIIDTSIKTPQIGDVVVTTDGSAAIGHVAIVSSVNGDRITLAESNFKKQNGVGIVTYDRQLSLSDGRILGYAHPKNTGSSNGSTVTPPELKNTTGNTDLKAFYDDVKTMSDQLATGKSTWGQAFSFIKSRYGAPDDVIDTLLGGHWDKNDPAKTTGWAVAGAYQKQLADNKAAQSGN